MLCEKSTLKGDCTKTNQKGGLYVVDWQSGSLNSYFISKSSVENGWLWHKRLSHLKFKTIIHLVKHQLVKGLPTETLKNEGIYGACQMGKLTKTSFKGKSAEPSTTKILELLQTLKEASRTMLVEAKIGQHYWAEAITTTYYTQNRSSINSQFNKTPYELYKGRKSSLAHLRPFGCPY